MSEPKKAKNGEMAGGLPYVYPPGRPKSWYSNENSLSAEYGNINSTIDEYYADCIYNDKFRRLQDTYKQIVLRKLKKDENSFGKWFTDLKKNLMQTNIDCTGDLLMANPL